MKRILEKINRSLDTSDGGWSGRKLTALALIVIIAIADGVYIKHCYTREDYSLFIEWTYSHFIAIGFCLGLVTFSQIIKLKNGNSEKKLDGTNTNS